MIEIDYDVVRRAQARDEAACRTIIEQLHRPVIATIYRFLGSRYRDEIEDIAQDVFLKVFRSIDRFEPERGVKFSTCSASGPGVAMGRATWLANG